MLRFFVALFLAAYAVWVVSQGAQYFEINQMPTNDAQVEQYCNGWAAPFCGDWFTE